MADEDIKAPPGLVLDPPTAPDIQAPPGLTLDPAASLPPSTTPTPENPTPNVKMPYDLPKDGAPNAPSALQQFGQGFWSQANPVTAVKGLVYAFQNPKETEKAILKAHEDLWNRATQAWNEGRYGDALDLGGSTLLPVIGPQIQAIEDEAKAGHTAKALGMGAGFIAPAVVTAGAGKVLGAIGKAGQATAEAGEAVLPVATEAETAAEVAAKSSPETALQNYIRARNIEKLKDAYNVASPDMRQVIQQQSIFQNAKEAGGDVGKFGKLMDETRQALPLEDHQAWKGATRGLQYEQASAGRRLMKAGARLIPGVRQAIDISDAAKAASDLMRSSTGRAGLAKLQSIPVGSPAFSRLWTLLKASAKTGGYLQAPAAGLNQDQPQFQPQFHIANPVERLRTNTLQSLQEP